MNKVDKEESEYRQIHKTIITAVVFGIVIGFCLIGLSMAVDNVEEQEISYEFYHPEFGVITDKVAIKRTDSNAFESNELSYWFLIDNETTISISQRDYLLYDIGDDYRFFVNEIVQDVYWEDMG